METGAAVEDTVAAIRKRFCATHQDCHRPLLVGLGGVPGSGKTTIAAAIASCWNATVAGSQCGGVQAGSMTVMALDGYHLTRAQLAAMPDPEEAARRRGAPYTFDPAALADDLATLRRTGHLDAPDFDHALKDPSPGAIKVRAASTRGPAGTRRNIVLVEGLYALLPSPAPWDRVAGAFDLRLFLDLPLDLTTERLTRRHMAVWGVPREEAHARASGSDYTNAVLVQRLCPPHAHLVLAPVPGNTALRVQEGRRQAKL